jgi:hypothetical protein
VPPKEKLKLEQPHVPAIPLLSTFQMNSNLDLQFMTALVTRAKTCRQFLSTDKSKRKVIRCLVFKKRKSEVKTGGKTGRPCGDWRLVQPQSYVTAGCHVATQTSQDQHDQQRPLLLSHVHYASISYHYPCKTGCYLHSPRAVTHSITHIRTERVR